MDTRRSILRDWMLRAIILGMVGFILAVLLVFAADDNTKTGTFVLDGIIFTGLFAAYLAVRGGKRRDLRIVEPERQEPALSQREIA